MNMKNIYKNISIVCASAILIGCGGAGGSGSGTTSKSSNDTKPQLIDSPIVGAKYVNADGSEGKTADDGQFDYTGGKVSFYVGKIKIGEVDSLQSDNKVFLQDILKLNRENVNDSKLLTSAQFLQSLDSIPSTDNIEIGANYAKFDTDTYNNKELKDLDVLSVLANENIAVKDLADVKTHLNNTVKTYIKKDEDTSAPFVNTITPRDNASGIALNEDIVLEFSENITKDSVLKANITLKDNKGNIVFTDNEVKDNKLTLKPRSSFSANTLYTLEIDGNIEDYAGNSLSSNKFFTFTTADANDKTPPILLSNSILEKQNDIDLLQEMILTFSEKMDELSINSNNIKLVKKADNKEFALKIRYSNNQINIIPKNVLDAKTTYLLKINGNLKDLNNNSFLAQDIEFTTNDKFSFNGDEYKVIISPITGKSWLDRNLGARKVCEDKADENCYGDYYQWGRKTNGHEKSSSEVFDASKIPLRKDVLSNGKFAVWADDWRENKNDDLWKGSDAINAVCPSGYKVPIIDEILIETKYVNETQYPGQKLDGQYSNLTNFLKLPNNGFRKHLTRTGILELQAYDGQVWSSTTNDVGLAYSFGYFPGGAFSTPVVRAYGKAVRCMKAYDDSVKPTVISTTPADNASDVSIDTEFRVQFSKPFISSPSRSNILLMKGEQKVAINILSNISNHIFVISPDKFQGDAGSGLSYDTEYKFIFKKDLYDVSGNTLAEDKIITFRTEKSPELRAPVISKIYPREGTSSAIRNENLKVTFSKELKTNTIDANIILKQGSTIIPSVKTYNNRVVTINPNSTLDANTTYSIEVLTGLSDTNNITVEQTITKTFTTGDEIAIEDTEGNIYKKITSPKTNKIWLDRNLGASKVCDNLNDSDCFGKYYTWNKSNFENICPSGFKVAGTEDLNDEIEGFTRTNLFDNFLKIPNNGKLYQNKSKDASSYSYLWSDSDAGSKLDNAKALKIITLDPVIEDENIENALGIRCIKKD